MKINFEKNKDFKNFKKKCDKTGTTEEALAHAEKLGFDTGYFVQHPFLKKKYQFILQILLMDYGTGAIFGCPAHDQRDFDFAKKYNLEIIKVVDDNNEIKSDLTEAFLGNGTLINSDFE